MDMIDGVNGRVKLIDRMIDGTKRSDPAEAKRYLNDIKTQLEKISELVSIS